MLRIDRKKSSFYIGAAVMPLDPDEGFAKYLEVFFFLQTAGLQDGAFHCAKILSARVRRTRL